MNCSYESREILSISQINSFWHFALKWLIHIRFLTFPSWTIYGILLEACCTASLWAAYFWDTVCNQWVQYSSWWTVVAYSLWHGSTNVIHLNLEKLYESAEIFKKCEICAILVIRETARAIENTNLPRESRFPNSSGISPVKPLLYSHIFSVVQWKRLHITFLSDNVQIWNNDMARRTHVWQPTGPWKVAALQWSHLTTNQGSL